MNTRYAALVALIVGVVLIAHAVLAFSKVRWVTGLLELIAAGVLLWQWWLTRGTRDLTSAAPPR